MLKKTIRQLGILLLMYHSAINQSNAQVAEFRVGEIFPISEIQTMTGQSYSIDSLNSELLVMNFWNIGCKGCLLEMPFLNKVHSDFKSESVSFWSITLNSKQQLTKYLEKHPINWEIKSDVEFTGIFGKSQFNIKCMPTTIVINKNKKILYAKCGPIMDDQNGAKFVELLKTGEAWKYE